ncbi:TPA: hypothetical protein ACJXXT_000179 [Pseudomonas aeruginosa]|uniref:hypothetical protein n=1 Tax=Pseudomonas putida TaxID=303 RepID=UPI001BAF73BD|nr:hypothetical protein [Pseudomonas putida]QUG90730.1 hypothetical protein GR140_18880 [Pseudomonas putida]
MRNKLTREVLSKIILNDSRFKDEDTHLASVDNIAGELYRHIKPYDYGTYVVMPSIVVNGLPDGVYESIHLTITLQSKTTDLYNIKTNIEFNKDTTVGFLCKITKAE